MGDAPQPIDLSPAQWIWLPSQRTLANTIVLFRRRVRIGKPLRRATGWISADSRYRISVNGMRIQFGPPPCDPRWLEADPIDLTDALRNGENAIGAEVLFYGSGDGTWPLGKPGFIFKLDLEYGDGTRERVVSDASWMCQIDRAHRPGQYRRWYLRAFQEEFDARLYPHGWNQPDYSVDGAWMPAMLIGGRADLPALCTNYHDYSTDAGSAPGDCQLRRRSIPMLTETCIPVRRLQESARIAWKRDPEDWFQFRVPNSFTVAREPVAIDQQPGHWRLPAPADAATGHLLTFEFTEQMVGWPYFTVDAPAGTIIELITQESHDPAKTAFLDSHFYTWTRFICKEGINTFECFDFECLRWLQLHVRNARRPVTVTEVGLRRRVYPWTKDPAIYCSETPLQRLFTANLNTIWNSAQETCVDGMGRERQQYSGDGGHQLHVIRYAYGETKLPARFINTFSQGMTLDGYFLDCWPAYDRLARLMERQVGATVWGPLLDHGVGFNFDCWHHYMQTGDLEAVREPYPRLLRFARYLAGLRGPDGLLPVENLGVPAVWMDHEAYRMPRHKQCAFNLYVAAMLRSALSPLARIMGQASEAEAWDRLGRELHRSVVERFWSAPRRIFVNNLPWLAEEKSPRLCDRSLATAILYDQCPEGRIDAAARTLAECPPEMGVSYPANAGWRYWALAKVGRVDAVLKDWRTRWATMRSVLENNTLQEVWQAMPDTTNQFSHCPVAPLYVLYMSIAGIEPVAPGFARFTVRPQLGDLPDLRLVAHTVRGPIAFEAERQGRGHRVAVSVPAGCEAEAVLPPGARDNLRPDGPNRFQLRAGATNVFTIP